MAKLTDDILKWSLEINGNPARKALAELEQSTRSLEQTNKQLRIELQKVEAGGKKNSEEYNQLDQQIKKNTVTIKSNKEEMDKMRKEIGINGLTIQQLRGEYRHLKIQMDNTTPNTPEWKRYNEQLKAIKNRQDELNGGISRTSSLFGGIKSLLPTLGIGAVITMVIKLGKEFLGLATSMEQMERKAKIVFGESLPMVKKEAAESAKQLGLTRSEFIKAAASTADLLVPLGFARDRSAELSVRLTKLSGALDEWSGGTLGAAQVNEILTKAMLGEAEQIKRLGIVIDQSSKEYNERIKVLEETEGVTREQARALEILNQIYQKSADAQTSFAQKGESLLRTQKSLTTSWRQLKENVVEWFQVPTEKKIEAERAGLNLMVNSLISVNEDQQARNRLIKELQASYPAFLQNLDLENLSTETLTQRLKEVNEQYDIRVTNAALENKMAEITEEQQKNQKKHIDNILIVNDYYSKYVVNQKEDANYEEKLRALREDSLNALTQNVGIRQYARSIVRDENKIIEKNIELQKKYDVLSKQRITITPPPSPGLSDDQVSDYYEAVKLGIITGEKEIRILTQTELNKLAEVRKENEDKKLQREKEASERRRQQREQEAAEQERLARQQAEEQQRLLEQQQDARQKIIYGSLSLIQQENIDYQERLDAAGIFGKKREEMTDEELQVLRILEREHQQKLNEIEDQQFTDNLAAITTQFNQEKLARERKYKEELLRLGDNEQARAALTEQYRREEMLRQAEHLQNMIAQYQAEMNAGVVNSLFASIPDSGIEEALLSDEEMASLQAKIDELKIQLAELGISMGNINPPEGKKDILGMSPEDWEKFETNFEIGIQIASGVSDTWAGINRIMANQDQKRLQEFEKNTQKKKQLLDKQLKDGLISQQRYDEQVALLDEATEERRRIAAVEAAKREKSQAYFNTIINTAAAVVKMYASSPPPFNFILAALVAAKGAIELGIIASEPLPQAAEGGYTDVIGADDKKWYKAKTTSRRGLITKPSILVAEKKPEYVVPGDLLEKDPTVKDMVNEIEMIRTRQYQYGGFTSDASKPLPQAIEGGYTDMIGADDKKRYKAKTTSKRGLITKLSILVAEKKPEYVVPGDLLEKDPTVKGMVNEIEMIRTRQYQYGGFTSEVMKPKIIHPIEYLTTLSRTAGQRVEIINTTVNTVEKTFSDPRLAEALNRFSQIMEQVNRNGLEVPWVKIKEKFDQYEKIQNSVNSR